MSRKRGHCQNYAFCIRAISASARNIYNLFRERSTSPAAAAGPPATVRYTLDGSLPSTTSTAYSSPFSVNTAMTIKARSFPNDGSAGSAIATSILTFNYGTLAAPTASPDAGVYADAQTVTQLK